MPLRYGGMCTLFNHTSPLRMSAKQSVSWQLFSRRERTSVEALYNVSLQLILAGGDWGFATLCPVRALAPNGTV